jgi:hypothetical protein
LEMALGAVWKAPWDIGTMRAIRPIEGGFVL